MRSGRHQGYEVDSRADEFFAVFAEADEDSRRRSNTEGYARCEMARRPSGSGQDRAQSGSPAVTDTGYVGLPVDVMARVCNAGHGGQFLLTDATREELG